ncbi:MAG: class II aldolase/adducin family protein [Anaerolineae bacterium]|nr:class II aldolase/adducin family protein [Phycisphaerae bacterium]
MATNGNHRPSFAPRASEWKLKEQMCDVGRRIWIKGFCAGNEGNHSYRLSENRVLCTPTGISKGQLKPEDICVVAMNGDQISGSRKRTSEIQLHLAIYKARPDVNAVLHSHPPHATAFAVAGVDLPTCIHPEAEVFLGAVKTARYVTPGDQRLGDSILPHVRDSNTILLQSHGVVTYADDLERAYYQLEIVDAYARILILAKQVGSIRPLEPGEMKELLALKERFGMTDTRDTEKLSCAADFVQRVNTEAGTRGRMVSDGGVAPVEHASQSSSSSPMDTAIASMTPENYSEADIEQLVQTITDQIMASAN